LKAHYLILLLFLCFACNKKNDSPADPGEDPVVDQPQSLCKDLPPTPEPFGWQDSITDPDKNVNAFIINPVNPNQVVIVVNGDMYGYNKMFSYDIPNKQLKYLATISNHLPSVNPKGWILYSTLDYDIYKIKANGDSLTPLVGGHTSEDPEWDYTGNHFYYYNRAFQTVPSQLLRSNANGGTIGGIPIILPYSTPYSKSDKIIFFQPEGKIVSLILHDMVTHEEKKLISGPYDPKETQSYFDDLTLDLNDENMYWSNKYGIFKCNLSTLKTDTVLKSCPNRMYENPIISFNANEMTVTLHIMTPLDSYRLLHEYKTMELNLLSKEIKETRLFN
jgi:hypothetical protein